jgi:hypothetical protein
VYSGSSLLTDLNFQSVSGLYKIFTRISPSESGFVIHLIGEKISKKDTAIRKAISVQERLALTLCFLASGDSYVSLPYLYKISKQAISRLKRVFIKKCAETFIHLIIFHSNVISMPNNV